MGWQTTPDFAARVLWKQDWGLLALRGVVRPQISYRLAFSHGHLRGDEHVGICRLDQSGLESVQERGSRPRVSVRRAQSATARGNWNGLARSGGIANRIEHTVTGRC
jgi:hypothetical protein